MPWPHEGSVQLHSVVGWVAVTAAVLLASVMAVIHHGPADLTVLSVPILLGILMACHAVLTRRRPIRGPDVGS